MSTQIPDRTPADPMEKSSNPLLEDARRLQERASAEISQGADLIRARVLKSAEALRNATFADHICSPPEML